MDGNALIDETRGSEEGYAHPHHRRTLILSKQASENGISHLLLATFTASEGPGDKPRASLQRFDDEREPVTFEFSEDEFEAFMEAANNWRRAYPLKSPAQ